MAIQDPMVADYIRRKLQEEEEAKAASGKAQTMSNLAGLGEAASNLLQSSNPQVMFNRWDTMGAAPQTSQAQTFKTNLDPLRRAGAAEQEEVTQRHAKAEKDFQGTRQIEDLAQTRADDAAQRNAASERANPQSKASVDARAYLRMVAPNATSIQGFDSLSADQIDKMAPGLMQAFNAQQNREMQNAARGEAREDRRLAREDRMQDRQDRYNDRDAQIQDKRAYDAGIKAQSADQKRQQAMHEIEDRRTTIKQNIALLRDQIKNDGTWEMAGSHNQTLERRVDEIATDMAKLMDPTSVARPSEVENVKRTLVKPGFSNRNSTADEILAEFERDIDRRADSAYSIRGLTPPNPKSEEQGQGNAPFSIEAIRAERARRGR